MPTLVPDANTLGVASRMERSWELGRLLAAQASIVVFRSTRRERNLPSNGAVTDLRVTSAEPAPITSERQPDKVVSDCFKRIGRVKIIF